MRRAGRPVLDLIADRGLEPETVRVLAGLAPRTLVRVRELAAGMATLASTFG